MCVNFPIFLSTLCVRAGNFRFRFFFRSQHFLFLLQIKVFRRDTYILASYGISNIVFYCFENFLENHTVTLHNMVKKIHIVTHIQSYTIMGVIY